MLLFIHSEGLGAVWLGQILANREKVLELVGGPKDLELMAVLALGYPAEKGGSPGRKGIKDTVFFRK
jgi:nitroreductase